MRKVILNMNMTLDGFFNLDWMGGSPLMSDQALVDDTLAQISGSDDASSSESGGVFVGYPFYSGMVQFWSDLENNPETSERERALAHAVNNSRRIVISRTEVKLEEKNSELLVVKDDQDLLVAVTRLKQQAGSDLGIIGGVRTAQTFARLGLIDEYQLLVNPVVIGEGERVWIARENLQLINVKAYPSGVMRVHYRKM